MTAPLDDLPAPDETPFKIETAEDLLDLPDPDWLVHSIIQRGTLALVYGPSGCGKSFLALDRIRQRTDVTVIVVHHSPLSDKDRPRGHSSLYAASDTCITVDQTGDMGGVEYPGGTEADDE